VIKKQPPDRRIPLDQSQTPGNSTQQFNATPRFNFSSTPRPDPSQQLPASTLSAARYLSSARHVQRHAENIIIPSGISQNIHDSIETENQEIDERPLTDDEDIAYEPGEPYLKRRRFSSSTDSLCQSEINNLDPQSSPPPVLSSPPIARHPASSRRAPRFVIASPASVSILENTQAPFVKPPRFRPPEPLDQTQAQHDPLPDQFSPHRRGQKYLPGGLAAEVRDWLMNIESTAQANGTEKKEGLWLAKLLISEVTGSSRTGLTLVRGNQEDTGAVMKVLLAGEGEGTGLQKGAKVEVGRMLGIKGTVWDVVIEGERWGVSVDWKVLI